MDPRGLGLREQVLFAALECCGGDCEKNFTAEELLVHAWQKDKMAWGLRGYEDDHPDSAKIYKELDAHAGKEGIVGKGLLEKLQQRVYRLTPAGLGMASALRPSDPIAREKAGRKLAEEIKRILEHSVFRKWLDDPSLPKHFREAGHFWGIAPGMPARTVRKRVDSVERTLTAASDFLTSRNVQEITAQRGQILFEREDIDRCLEFQTTLRNRFAQDLQLLDPKIELNP
jgi:hypothetical protein